jgi:ribosomal protein S18 acetylase RimI-like enzyme
VALHLRHRVLPSDRQAVRALVEATGFFRANEVDVAEELVRECLSRGEASGYHFLFAERDGQLAGYACYGPIAVTLGSWDLYWIIVHPNFQRQGIGAALLADAEKRICAAQGRQIYIETSSQPLYQPTQSFYARGGYVLEATLKDFYAPGDDKLVFVKRCS